MASADRIKETKTYHYPKGIVRVHIPDLTEEERARRMKIIAGAAAELLKSQMEKDKQMESEVRMA